MIFFNVFSQEGEEEKCSFFLQKQPNQANSSTENYEVVD